MSCTRVLIEITPSVIVTIALSVLLCHGAPRRETRALFWAESEWGETYVSRLPGLIPGHHQRD